jgi:PAS domain S-box-containing protein
MADTRPRSGDDGDRRLSEDDPSRDRERGPVGGRTAGTPAESARRELEVVLSSLDERVYVCDPETRDLLYTSGPVRERAGEPAGRKCFEVLRGRSSPCPSCPNEHLFGEHPTSCLVSEYQDERDGRWYRCVDKAIMWPDGRRVRCGIALDITEHKKVEEALRRSEEAFRENEERYRAVSELTSDFAYMIRIESDGTIVPEWVSGAFERITGYSTEEIATPGRWLGLLLDEDRATWTEHFQSFTKGLGGPVEYRIETKTGEVRWLRDLACPVWDPAHTRVTRIYGAIQDISRQREAEKIQSVLLQISQAVSSSPNLVELLATIHEQLGTLIDTTNFYVALYEEKTDTYTFPYHVDQCDTIDALTQLQLKKSLTDYVRRTGKPLLVDEETNERLTREGEIELIGAPSPIWLGAPLIVSKRVIGVVVVQSYVEGSLYSVRDLEIMTFVSDNIAVAIERKRGEEERGRLQAQILHAQKLESLGVLAGGIAHDFNNLLTGILGNADLGLMGVQPGSPTHSCLRAIKTTSERAADLSRQMLAYSGKGSFIIGPIDLNDVVREMGHLLEVSVSKKAVLRYQLASDLPPIVADATQVRQVIMNLITNASDAIGESEGVISISTGVVPCTRADLATSYLDDRLPEGQYVFLTVEDTGTGMDAQTLQRIFDPFFTTKFTGRGLGLAAALGIVRGHKGAVQVESEVGRGTRFRILLPVAGEPARVGEKAEAHASDARQTGTVLLVDDEAAIRDIGARMLEQAGLTVVTAADGLEAVEFLRQHPHEVSCVLLDLSMPHMGGEETFRELRLVRGDIPVVLSSGYSEQEVVSRFAGQGIAGFVQKPYLVAQLVAEVGAAMKGAPGGGTAHAA